MVSGGIGCPAMAAGPGTVQGDDQGCWARVRSNTKGRDDSLVPSRQTPQGEHPHLEGKPKYRNLEGSVGGVLYPDGFPLPGKPLLLVEGEFDCLLLRQKVGRLLQVVTLGSTSSQPTAEALTALSFGSPFLVGLDADDAGNKAAGVWATLAPRSKRLRTPKGKIGRKPTWRA